MKESLFYPAPLKRNSIIFNNDIEWPPSYVVKKHRRARHVKLRATKPHGLQVTVPYRFNLKELPAILNAHKTWIIKQLLQLQLQMITELPAIIALNALGETWTVSYVEVDAHMEIIHRPHQEIVLVGRIADKKSCQEQLILWLKEKAKQFLMTELNSMSDFTQLPYKSVSVREQKTLWGSCTVNKSISLNYKLIFLPPALMRHVLIHELCHTKHLNHSTKFWNLVAQFDPAWAEHKRALRHAEQWMPMWV